MGSDPFIFDIRHFTLDDGPGIRTTVFLKGCPLSCAWCHNPEGMNKNQEVAFHSERCIHCGTCKSVCPNRAIDMENKFRVITTRCDCCGRCTSECPTNALRIIGKYYSPDELVQILLSDKVFYRTSGGGVTFSGGEPTLFMDYLSGIFRELKNNDIHITIQTSGTFDSSIFKDKLLPFLDLILFDLKLMDDTDFHRWTGGNATLPLDNFERLCKQTDVRVIASVPLIPGITSTKKNLMSLKAFLKKSGCHEFIFRPYHPGGIAKSISLGKAVSDFIPEKPLSITEEQMARRYFRKKQQRSFI
jgi:pyruvate formate lyase activating enzyme